MTKYEIVDKLSRENQVEKIVFKLLPSSKNRFDCPEDLVQDIYILLLEKEDDFIEKLYNKGELGFWILGVVKKQLISENSRYYYKYIKFKVITDELEAAKDFIAEDRG